MEYYTRYAVIEVYSSLSLSMCVCSTQKLNKLFHVFDIIKQRHQIGLSVEMNIYCFHFCTFLYVDDLSRPGTPLSYIPFFARTRTLNYSFLMKHAILINSICPPGQVKAKIQFHCYVSRTSISITTF